MEVDDLKEMFLSVQICKNSFEASKEILENKNKELV